MEYGRSFMFTLVAAIAFLATAGQANAQQKFSIEGRGGIAVPASDLADLQDAGPSFGVGFAYRINPRIALRVDGDLDILSGVDSDGSGPAAPDMNVWHYNGGVTLRVTNPQSSSRWTADVNLGAGASTLDVDPFDVEGETIDFSETYFTANGGVKIGYDVTPQVNVFVGGQAYLIFTDENDTAAFGQLRSDVQPFDTAWTFPFTAGLAIRF